MSGNGSARAVVVNAGIANACTGEEGYSYCRQTAEKAAGLLSVSKQEVLVASTGVIGMQSPSPAICFANAVLTVCSASQNIL